MVEAFLDPSPQPPESVVVLKRACRAGDKAMDQLDPMVECSGFWRLAFEFGIQSHNGVGQTLDLSTVHYRAGG